MRFLAVAGLALLLAGCYGSLNHLRDAAPLLTTTVHGQPRAMADCMRDRLLLERNMTTEVAEARTRTVHLTQVNRPDLGYVYYTWEMIFIPVADGSARVELRSFNSLWGPFADRGEMAGFLDTCQQLLAARLINPR